MRAARSARWSRARAAVVVAAVAAGSVVGCETGSATIRIDQGEDIVDRTVRQIAERLELAVQTEVPLGSRRPCSLPGNRDGASNTVSLQGPLPPVDDPLGHSAAVLVDNDFELVADSGGPDLIFGRRDGMRVTVDQGGDQLAIDGSTGCRPLPER